MTLFDKYDKMHFSGNVSGNVTGIWGSMHSSSKKRTVTIHDVAKAARVSVSTVSRVLNEKDDVAPETYNKVKAVIFKKGFVSNLAARSMRSRKTNVIGLIMPDVEDPFSIEVMKGVNRAITAFDYDLLVYTNGDIKKNASAEQERYYVNLLNNSITDGVIIVAPAATSFSTSAPVVAIDPNKETPNCPAVIATNREGAMSALTHLFSLGHTRIAHITGRMDLQSAIRRRKGYEDALLDRGLPIDADLIQDGDFKTETAKECARKLLMLPSRPTAIFAANDQSAIGVFRAAEELGLSIPDDLSVVGFDNIPEARFLSLTTVDQSISTLGLTATQMLMRLINGEELESQTLKIPTHLVVRGSTKAVV